MTRIYSRDGVLMGIFANDAQAVLAAAIHGWRDFYMRTEGTAHHEQKDTRPSPDDLYPEG